MTEEILAAAKKDLNEGFPVIPVHPKDKRPAILSWSEFQRRKPTENELMEWFGNGEKNIAIVCGEVSGGLVVVDYETEERFKRALE